MKTLRHISLVVTVLAMGGLTGSCASSSYTGFTIASPPKYYADGLHSECGRYLSQWERLASQPIYPELGVSRIKEIVSATYQLGMTYLAGCPEAGLEPNTQKGIAYISASNEFAFPPARLALGIMALEGRYLDQDPELAREYILFAYHCDLTVSRQYGRVAQKVINEHNWPHITRRSRISENCPIRPGNHFKGPNYQFDDLAYKIEYEGRLAETQARWSWVGSTINVSADMLAATLPIVLMGASAYYSAKYTGPSSSVEQQLSAKPVPLQVASHNSCSTDLECGIGAVCVKPGGSFSMRGLCGTLVNEQGAALPTNWNLNIGPRDVLSCRTNVECPLGFSCQTIEPTGQGVCSK